MYVLIFYFNHSALENYHYLYDMKSILYNTIM